MLTGRAPGAALILALVASVSLAQTGEADPPSAGTVPGSTEERAKAKPVLTLEEKRKLVVLCAQTANRKKAQCQGIAVPEEPEPADPES
jgi:hypothetical protein